MTRLCILIVLATLLLPAVLLGQGTDLGSIRGDVTDPSGAAVPNATVSITDVATDTRIVVKTSQTGEFEATGLRSGAYKVSVAATGFSTIEISGITLPTGGTARANARLE